MISHKGCYGSRRMTAFISMFLVFAAGACKAPKYAVYESVHGDYFASVPWGWKIMTDQQDDSFSHTNFIGPFDPDFYLGVPSLSVRWYKRYGAHRLRNGRIEMYENGSDFIAKTLKQVYGPDYVFIGPNGESVDQIATIKLKSSGLNARYFTVLSPTPAPEKMRWGISEQKGTGKSFILRKHSYAVVDMADGFYVFCYPATEAGYDRYSDRFLGLIGSFKPWIPKSTASK